MTPEEIENKATKYFEPLLPWLDDFGGTRKMAVRKGSRGEKANMVNSLVESAHHAAICRMAVVRRVDDNDETRWPEADFEDFTKEKVSGTLATVPPYAYIVVNATGIGVDPTVLIFARPVGPVLDACQALSEDIGCQAPIQLPLARSQLAEAIGVQDPLLLSTSKEIATLQDYPSLLDEFKQLLAISGYKLEPVDKIIDLLACALSSQLLLFAGPSGSGKSFAGKLLSNLFQKLVGAPSAKLNVRMGWLGPEEVGGYPPIGGQDPEAWIPGPLMESLDVGIGFLLVEEANLSKIEGYLNPIIHGLSETTVQAIEWMPWMMPGHKHLRHYPRIVATINVDENSDSPSRKVLARAGVVIFESDCSLSPAFFNPGRGTLNTSTQVIQWLGEPIQRRIYPPQRALELLPAILPPEQSLDTLIPEALYSLLNSVESIRQRLSPRTMERISFYIASYLILSHRSTREDGSDEREMTLQGQACLALCNAIAHFVIPLMEPKELHSLIQSFEREKDASRSAERLQDWLKPEWQEQWFIRSAMAMLLNRMASHMRDPYFIPSFWDCMS